MGLQSLLHAFTRLLWFGIFNMNVNIISLLKIPYKNFPITRGDEVHIERQHLRIHVEGRRERRQRVETERRRG